MFGDRALSKVSTPTTTLLTINSTAAARILASSYYSVVSKYYKAHNSIHNVVPPVPAGNDYMPGVAHVRRVTSPVQFLLVIMRSPL